MRNSEKEKQESLTWDRGTHYATYNEILGYYQVRSCLENARGTSLLDLPCGDGTLTAMFAEHFRWVVGVDASGAHLAKARQKLPGVEFHESLIEELSLKEKFGTVVMLNILEHVVDPLVTLRKAASFLEKNGVLIVQVPNAHAVNRKIAVLMGTLSSCEELSPFDLHVAGHRRSYTIAALIDDAQRAGLRVEKTGGVFYKSLSTPQIYVDTNHLPASQQLQHGRGKCDRAAMGHAGFYDQIRTRAENDLLDGDDILGQLDDRPPIPREVVRVAVLYERGI